MATENHWLMCEGLKEEVFEFIPLVGTLFKHRIVLVAEGTSPTFLGPALHPLRHLVPQPLLGHQPPTGVTNSV